MYKFTTSLPLRRFSEKWQLLGKNLGRYFLRRIFKKLRKITYHILVCVEFLLAVSREVWIFIPSIFTKFIHKPTWKYRVNIYFLKSHYCLSTILSVLLHRVIRLPVRELSCNVQSGSKAGIQRLDAILYTIYCVLILTHSVYC